MRLVSTDVAEAIAMKIRISPCARSR
jgi:hypothetical protein